MTTEKEFYQIPRQFEFDDMRFGPTKTPASLTRIREDLELTSQDILSTGLPKTGTTRTNEVLFQILAGGDEEVIRNTPPAKKMTYIELDVPNGPSSFDTLMKLSPPRLVRSHLPARYFERQLREKGPKIVVSVRNPKDTIVSFFHFYRMNQLLGNFEGPWDEFFDMYKHEKLTHEDYMKYYVGWWEKKDHPNVMFVKFEDFNKDPHKMVADLAKFVEQPLSEEQINTIVKLTSFDNVAADAEKARAKGPPGGVMNGGLPNGAPRGSPNGAPGDPPNGAPGGPPNGAPNGVGRGGPPMAGGFLPTNFFNEKISKFFRKGKVGDWKNHFSDGQSRFVDEQYERLLKPLGLELEFE